MTKKSTILKAATATATALLFISAANAQLYTGSFSAKVSGATPLGYHQGGNDPFPPSAPEHSGAISKINGATPLGYDEGGNDPFPSAGRE